MKIIEGSLAGKIIQYKEQKGTRVTSDKVRKSVFDVLKGKIGNPSTSLGTNLSGLKVADLFCGSGMFGLESLSRGVSSVYFIDDSKSVVNSLKRNIKILDIGYWDIKIINKKFETFLKSSDEKFDLVFADPPYYKFDYEKLNDIYSILNVGGILVLESSKRVKVGDLKNLELIVEKKYWDTKILIFRKN